MPVGTYGGQQDSRITLVTAGGSLTPRADNALGPQQQARAGQQLDAQTALGQGRLRLDEQQLGLQARGQQQSFGLAQQQQDLAERQLGLQQTRDTAQEKMNQLLIGLQQKTAALAKQAQDYREMDTNRAWPGQQAREAATTAQLTAQAEGIAVDVASKRKLAAGGLDDMTLELARSRLADTRQVRAHQTFADLSMGFLELAADAESHKTLTKRNIKLTMDRRLQSQFTQEQDQLRDMRRIAVSSIAPGVDSDAIVAKAKQAATLQVEADGDIAKKWSETEAILRKVAGEDLNRKVDLAVGLIQRDMSPAVDALTGGVAASAAGALMKQFGGRMDQMSIEQKLIVLKAGFMAGKAEPIADRLMHELYAREVDVNLGAKSPVRQAYAKATADMDFNVPGLDDRALRTEGLADALSSTSHVSTRAQTVIKLATRLQGASAGWLPMDKATMLSTAQSLAAESQKMSWQEQVGVLMHLEAAAGHFANDDGKAMAQTLQVRQFLARGAGLDKDSAGMWAHAAEHDDPGRTQKFTLGMYSTAMTYLHGGKPPEPALRAFGTALRAARVEVLAYSRTHTDEETMVFARKAMEPLRNTAEAADRAAKLYREETETRIDSAYLPGAVDRAVRSGPPTSDLGTPEEALAVPAPSPAPVPAVPPVVPGPTTRPVGQ